MDMPSMKFAGYTVRFRERAMKWRKRKNGRARGFYGGVAIYLRVRGPDGVTRDLYLGNDERSATPSPKARGSKGASSRSSSSSPATSSRGGRTRGQKPSWRDEQTARAREVLGALAREPQFESRERWKQAIANPKTGLRKYRR